MNKLGSLISSLLEFSIRYETCYALPVCQPRRYTQVLQTFLFSRIDTQQEEHGGEFELFSVMIRLVASCFCVKLPLSLLKTAQNHPILIELKNGETYNGMLVSCDSWMNVHLKDAICTSKVEISHASALCWPSRNSF